MSKKYKNKMTEFAATIERIGDPRFHALLVDIGRLHDKKQKDYGKGSDSFAGYNRPSKAIGLSPWKSPFLRLSEKQIRLENYALTGRLANESAVDSFRDIAVLALICLILHQEEKEVAKQAAE